MAQLSNFKVASPIHSFIAVDSLEPLESNQTKHAVTGRDPLFHFPIAILSKAIDLGNEIVGAEQFKPILTSEKSVFLSLVGVVLNLNRTYWRSYHSEEVNVISLKKPGKETVFYALSTPGGMSLGINESNELFLCKRGEVELFSTAREIDRKVPPLCSRLSRMISEAIERKVIAGSPSLVFPEHGEGSDRLYRDLAMRILDVIRNSPYNDDLASGSHKGRFQFIGAINSPENQDSISLIKESFKRRPSLTGMRGWCEGGPLHKAAQLGSLTLVSLVEEACSRPECPVSFEELVNTRDADGSTPYHLAVRYGHPEVADYLARKGANVFTENRYNFVAPSESTFFG